MSILVFFSRYFFIEPKVPLKLNKRLLAFLNYSSIAVLTAIWAPIVFTSQNKLNIDIYNAYLIGALVAVALIWKTKNVLLTVVVSMCVFWGIRFWS